MLKHGFPPYLECSSKNPTGDKRFSAFYARIVNRGNKTIEDIYQASKIFENGETNLSIKDAKGRKAINMQELSLLYSELWDEYFQENADLYQTIKNYEGFSDIFGQQGHQCQATEIYRIWVKFQLKNLDKITEEFKHLVVNKRKTNVFDVYCGRGSVFGNQYSHLPESKAEYQVATIDQAMAHFRFNLIRQCSTDSKFKESVKTLNGKVLACYCSMPSKPKPCHCYFLAAASQAYAKTS